MTLPPPEFRIVPPPADGLAGAFRAAAQRRRRKAATTGGAGVLTAAVVFAVLTGGTGQVLTSEPVVPAEQAPGLVELVPAGPTPTAAPLVGGVAAGDASGTAGQQAAGQVRDGRSTTTVAAPPRATTAPARPGPAPRAVPAYRPGAMDRDDGTRFSVPGIDCGAGTGLCSQVTFSGETISVHLCNGDADVVHLDFPVRDEVDVVVVDAASGDPVWHWGAGRSRVSDPHQVRVGMSECLSWSTPWASVDQSGAKLRPGSYSIRSTITSPDLGPAAKATASHSVY